MNIPRTRWPSQAKIIISLLALILFVYLLSRFSIALPPLILAVILAYLLSPLVAKLQLQFKIPRGLATVLAYLLLLVMLILLPLILLPPLASQLMALNLDIRMGLRQFTNLLSRQYIIFGQVIDGSALLKQVGSSFMGFAEPFIGQTVFFLVDIISSVVWIVFILVVSFYLVKDGPKIRKWLENLPPPQFREDYVRLRDEISLIWGSFFRGQLILAAVVAVLLSLSGIILGLPFALAMGILAGLLEFLPSIGHGIWLTIAVLLSFFLGSTWLPLPNWTFALLVIGLHLVYQQFDLNYLIPRIIGHSVHLPPLVVILGIVAGAVTAGVLGILLAAPTIASGRVIARYTYANLFDLDPFPPLAPPAMQEPDPEWWRMRRKAK